MTKKFWKGVIIGLLIVLPFWVWVGSEAFGETYFLRADGTGTKDQSKGSGTGSCAAAGTAMSISTHDGETYAAGDTIYLCDTGGVFRDQMDVPSSGNDGLPITYEAATGDTPIISGIDIKTGFTSADIDGDNANLSGNAETIGGTGWSNNEMTMDADVASPLAPDGSQTADAAQPDVGLGAKQMAKNLITGLAAATDYSYSVYVRAAAAPASGWEPQSDCWIWVRLQFVNAANDSLGETDSYFNVIKGSGALGTLHNDAGLTGTAAIYDVGDGWYRCVIMSTSPASTTKSNILLRTVAANGGSTMTGDGTTHSVWWGSKLEQATTALAYEDCTDYYVASAATTMVQNDGVYLTKSDDPSYQLYPGQFHYTADDAGRIYLRLTGDANPSGSVIGSMIRLAAIDTNAEDYITIKNLTLTGTGEWGAGVAVTDSQHITVDSCDLSDNYYAGVYAGDSGHHGYTTIQDSTFTDNGGPSIVAYYEGAIVDDGYNVYTGNTFTGNGWRDTMQSVIYIGGSNTEISNNKIYANNVDNPTWVQHNHGIYCFNVDSTDLDIHGNEIYDQGSGCGIKVRGAGNIYNNLVYDNWYGGISILETGSVRTVNIFSNIVYGNFNGLWVGLYDSGALTLNVYNNDFINNSNQTYSTHTADIYITDDVQTLVIKNNIIGQTENYPKETADIATQTNATIDYNYWRFAAAYGDGRIVYNDAATTWAEWQVLGFDTHGLRGDPLFTNAAGGDFTLTSTSPCINRGTEVGMGNLTDYDGNNLLGAVDIGALEYQQAENALWFNNVTGNDSNTSISSSVPLLSFSHLSGLGLADGCIIYLYNGAEWPDNFSAPSPGFSGGEITLKPYGGDGPAILTGTTINFNKEYWILEKIIIK